MPFSKKITDHKKRGNTVKVPILCKFYNFTLKLFREIKGLDGKASFIFYFYFFLVTGTRPYSFQKTIFGSSTQLQEAQIYTNKLHFQT